MFLLVFFREKISLFNQYSKLLEQALYIKQYAVNPSFVKQALFVREPENPTKVTN